jgi:hypothetical protein
MTMRSNAALIGIAMAAAILGWASTAPAQTNRAGETNSSQSAPAAHSCPPGTHWEEAGYIHNGKWRDAGCLKDGGRE